MHHENLKSQPFALSLSQRFEAQVERTPNAVAVVFEGQQLTYCELNRRANRLAHRLHRLNVKPESLVGLCVTRSPEMMIGILGILKAGGTYVPLDPQHPHARLDTIRQSANLKIILGTSDTLAAWGTGDELQLVEISEITTSDATGLTGLNSIHHTPDQLAYVLHTSGTTGTPKGVMIEHHNVLAMLQAFEQIAVSGERLSGTSVCSFNFDVSVWEFFSTLCFGGTLHILLPDVFADAERLVSYLVDQQITSAYIPPALLPDVASGLERRQTQIALERILVGVEPIKQNVLQRFRNLSDRLHIVNGYGPTETTICATFFKFQSTLEPDQRTPIGMAVSGYRIHIVDQHLQPVPTGMAGELYIGGVGVARGYLNRPDLTAEKFIPDPFSDEPGSRLYRTGDLARYRPDGNIEFLGRIDHQVKVRGFRIELSEIETVLQQHPAIQQAVVLLRARSAHDSGEKQLVGYVVFNGQSAPDVHKLRDYLAQKLPEYMVPAAWVVLDSFPLTPNGKIDRPALPLPDHKRPDLGIAYVPPRNPLEETLVRIWSQALGLEQIGIHDNFLEFGGHSLTAIQIIARIRDAFQIELPLTQLFKTLTIAKLAETMIASYGVKAEQNAPLRKLPADNPIISRIPRAKTLVTGISQEQIWFVQQLYPDAMPYNFQATLRLQGRLNVPALEQSLTEIVRRHEIYRTTFPVSDGRPVQVIHSPWPVQLGRLDLQQAPEDTRDEVLQRWLKKELSQAFDITRLPLLRWTLVQFNEQDYALIHVEHHLVHDGWSFRVFLNELLQLYRALDQGEPSPLLELSVQFADFAYWQRQWLAGEAAKEQLAYWRATLAGSQTVLELPADRPRPAIPSFQGAAPRIDLPEELCEALMAFSRREGVTLFMTMLTAFLTLLYRYTGQVDINVGSGVANRRLREFESLIGMLVNVVVLRGNLSGDPTVRELLQRIHQVTLEAFAHQDVPFENIVEAVQPERTPSYNPIFQSMFSFHDAALPQLDLPGLTVDVVEGLSNASAKFDLNIVALPHTGYRVSPPSQNAAAGITLVWEYSADLFEPATIGRMIEHYTTLLKAMVQQPKAHISRVDLLSAAERHRVLVEWNATTRPYPREHSLWDLLQAQAAQRPDAVALVCGGNTLTYRALVAQARQVATQLRTAGVGPEVLVGVCLERSLEWLVSVVGIVAAGGAYVPMDPHNPPERLAFLAHDLTQAQGGHRPLVLTTADLAQRLPLDAVKVMLTEAILSSPTEAGQEFAMSVWPDTLAYVMYTSGSTGQPKGSAVSQRNVVRLVKEQTYARLGPDEIFLQAAPVAFDASTLEIWGCLLNGSRLVILPGGAPTLAELGQVLEQEQVSVLWLTAGLFHQMVDEQLTSLGHVRQLLAGGDVLSPEHVRRVLAAQPQTVVINGYGPTECTTFTTCCPMHSPDQVGESVSIGQPLANTQVYILDREMQPVPIGVPGELYVGGDGLSRGYLNRSDLTAQAFVPNPFGEAGARLYKTGDLVRYRADGRIEFLGRRDQQVKLRGFRIELGEIETVLQQHPAIRQAVVVMHVTRAGMSEDKQLVAYLLQDDTQLVTGADLRAWLKVRVPDYLIPTAFVTLAAFPLTANGKIDRRALPAPDRADLGVSEAFVAPGSVTEIAIAQIWSDALGIEKISVHDNFFALGGHSLIATRVLSRLRDAFQIDLPLRSLFDSPTIAALAVVVEDMLIADIDALTDDETQQLVELKSGG